MSTVFPARRRYADVHMFSYRGLNLVYDVNSGSLHAVDELGWDVIDLFRQGKKGEEIKDILGPKYSPGDIDTALREVDELREASLLLAPSPFREPDGPVSYAVKSLSLFVAEDCNLSCRYCFAAENRGRRYRRMDWETAQKAVDFLLRQEGGRHVEIDFFGGEPLLNFPVVEKTVNYAAEETAKKGKEISFTLTTNACLLDDSIAAFLNRKDINVILSLDGRPEVHDFMRRRPGGSGSHAEVLQRSMEFLQSRGHTNYFVRGTFTRYNLDFCSDVAYLLELGLNALSLEPVVAGEDSDYALREEDLGRLEREYDRLVELYLDRKKKNRPFQFYHFILDLESGPCLYKRLSGCGAGVEYLAVASDGELYPCHQFIGDGRFSMGNLHSEPFVLERRPGLDIYHGAQGKEECTLCWARYLCGYGCAASSFYICGDLCKCYALACALQKMRLERALYLQAV